MTSIAPTDPRARDAEPRARRILDLLERAYWMEIETVMNYLAASINPDGVRAQEIREVLEEDVAEELDHARRFGERIKELWGVVPGSMAFPPTQPELQPPENQTDVVHVIKGVIAAERAAAAHYREIIASCEGYDWVTQDLAIGILRDEERHLRLFEGFLREYQVSAADGGR
ncbi:MAG: ferritin-like domain-containing protein [Actinomycetota bacterium]